MAWIDIGTEAINTDHISMIKKATTEGIGPYIGLSLEEAWGIVKYTTEEKRDKAFKDLLSKLCNKCTVIHLVGG